MDRSCHLVLYDADCAFCRSQVRLLRRLDWLKRFQFLPRFDPRVAGLVPGLDVARLPEAICCVSKDWTTGASKGIYSGAPCIGFMAARIPVLLPMGLLLRLPGIAGLAASVYDWIAKNRYRLSRSNCNTGCKTPGD